jgi:murein DD-endopeptidase MepM/ murein hydrolase activator NlpD
VLRAVRFDHPDGSAEYYAPDGASMRKALTRNPIDFTRISSRFNPRRQHPILNKVRAHKGVDYAAPTGTPVRAAGDGKVVFRGVRGGYGNVIVVQHGATFSTLYAHLSRFATGIGNGSRVRQDQVIGYVGRTGLATAPHLHYEVLVNGVHRNPRTVALPDAAPVPAELRAEFAQRSSALLDLLPTPAPTAVRT